VNAFDESTRVLLLVIVRWPGPRIDTMGTTASAALTVTDARPRPHAPRKLHSSAVTEYVTPLCNTSLGTVVGGDSVKFLVRNFCRCCAASGKDALDTTKLVVPQALPALPTELDRSTVSALQLLITLGALMLTFGSVRVLGAAICTTVRETFRHPPQLAALANEHAALIVFSLMVTLLPIATAS
jgi:hypothetical protein